MSPIFYDIVTNYINNSQMKTIVNWYEQLTVNVKESIEQ